MRKILTLTLLLFLSACAGMKIPYISSDEESEPPYPYDMAIRSVGWPCEEIVDISSRGGKGYQITEVTCQNNNNVKVVYSSRETLQKIPNPQYGKKDDWESAWIYKWYREICYKGKCKPAV